MSSVNAALQQMSGEHRQVLATLSERLSKHLQLLTVNLEEDLRRQLSEQVEDDVDTDVLE
jgi:hypothetical protein